ncbi:MAG: hypothetical protein DMF93_04335 [Acidobacteria bacterium]|nr:MAG: hypothetical protein DMF93_04335 [Acidobacteriota bacterium]
MVAWMVAASLLSWTAIAAAVDARTRGAALLGMLGPLVVALASWMIAERAWRRDPASLTSWMIAAFAGKMVFFAAYVAVMLKALSLAPAPFAASFAGYFIALHLFEALSLRAMFAGDGL